MKTIVSLFDESGNALAPWAQAGFRCIAFDIKNRNTVRNGIEYRYADFFKPSFLGEVLSLKPDLVLGFPPCTDLATSGAMHFEKKLAADPEVFNKAMSLVRIVPIVGDACGCPWMFENPVSRIATLYRKPDFIFDPWEYGGYLPEDDVHPRWPQFIAPRDAYPKTTCIWTGNGFKPPPTKPVTPVPGRAWQYLYLGGASERTKKIRSETPRGFARAVFEANK